MRSHLSQTVKNVLRKGRSSRSRRPSSFRSRDFGEEYTGGGESTRSYIDDSSSHRFHRGRRPSDSDASTAYQREGSVMSRLRGRSSRRHKSQLGEDSQGESSRRRRSLWHQRSQRNTSSTNWGTKEVDGNVTPSPRGYAAKSVMESQDYMPASVPYRPAHSFQDPSPITTPAPVTRRTLQVKTRSFADNNSPGPVGRAVPVASGQIHRGTAASPQQLHASPSPNRGSAIRAPRGSPQHRVVTESPICPAMAEDSPAHRSGPHSYASSQRTHAPFENEAKIESCEATQNYNGAVAVPAIGYQYPTASYAVTPRGTGRFTPRHIANQTSESAYASGQDYLPNQLDIVFNLSGRQELYSAYTQLGTPTDLTKFFFPREWMPSRFRSIRKIASAIHGEVRCARDHLDGNKEVVVKVIRNSAVRPREPGELENPLVEIGAMTFLHSNKSVYRVDLVAKMLGVYQDNKYTYLVSEHCSGGELFREVVARKCFHERLVKAVALQLALALLSLHKNGICHRDVSLENTLLAGDRTIRLIDFGQAECIYNADGSERWLTGSAGKDYYRAPEMTRGPYLGPPVDVFALGVEIFIMAIGSPPWNEATPNDARYRSLTSRVDALDIAFRKWGKRSMLSNAFVDLVSGIFCAGVADPKDRPTVEELLLHPWFSHDLGIWLWVENRGHSVTIKQQKERVFAYLRDVDPRGKFFYRPCGSAVSSCSAISPNTMNPPRELGAPSSAAAAHDRAAAARHRRPHA